MQKNEYSNEKTRDIHFYLARCTELGMAAGKKGNSPVGAVLVRNQKIISEAEEAGASKNDVTCHAEIEAIRIAVKTTGTQDLSNCTLYTSHEPCIMCSYVIRFYKIKKVVFLHRVDFLGGVSSSMPLLTTQQVPAHWNSPPEILQAQEES